MDILKYELLKILTNKGSKIYCIITCIFLMSFVFISSDGQIHNQDPKEYYSIIETYKDDKEELEKEIQEYKALFDYEKSLNQNDFITKENEVLDLEKEYQDKIDKGINIYQHLSILQETQAYLLNLEHYNDYQSTILLSNVNESLKTQYSNISTKNIYALNYMPMKMYSSQNIIGLLILLTTILLFINIFDIEEKSSMHGILRISRYGKTKSYIFKIFSIFLLLGVICIFYNSAFFIALVMKYSTFDLFANIQSIPNLYTSPFDLNILQFIIISSLQLFMMSIVVLAILIFIKKLLKSTKYAIVGILGIFIINFIWSVTIDVSDANNYLYYFNLFRWFTPEAIIKYGNVLSFNGFRLYIYQVFIGVVLSSLIIIGLCKSVMAQRNKELNIYKFVMFKGNHTSLFLHEIYKLLIMKKGLVILCLLMVWIGVQRVNQYEQLSTIGNELAKVYETYGGKLDEKKIQTIETTYQEYEELNELYKTSNQKYHDNQLPLEVYMPIEQKYFDTLYENQLFHVFYNNYANRLNDTIVYREGYAAVFAFDKPMRNIQNILILMVGIIMLFASFFVVDQKENEQQLYVITKKGKYQRNRSKLVITFIICIGLYIVFFGSEIALFLKTYGLSYWSEPVTSIMSSTQDDLLPKFISESFSLSEYFIFIQMIRFVGLVLLSFITLLISRLMKSEILVFITVFMITLIPYVLVNIGLDGFMWVSLYDVIDGNLLVLTQNYIWKLGFVLLFILLIAYYIIKDRVVINYSKFKGIRRKI